MRLDHATWLEVEKYLEHKKVILVPVGSTEQHGPMGIIGTDALCAEHIAQKAGEKAGVYVAPTLAYTPAPFNMAFPGTMSLSEPLFEQVVAELVSGLLAQGFECIYFLNGHGANLAPIRRIADTYDSGTVIIRSWWEYEAVDTLRKEYYGAWEGMHATPSEIAITQAVYRTITSQEAQEPPRKLSAEYMKLHAGDRHGPADEHRAEFPDGRVGSHSALARPKHGQALIAAAISAVANDVDEKTNQCN
jgi:creatinine amidohydrolase